MLFKGRKVSPKGEWWQIAIIHQKETISETEGSRKHKWQKDPLGKFLVKYFWGPKFRYLLQEQAAFLTSWLSVVHKPHRCLNFVIAKWMNVCSVQLWTFHSGFLNRSLQRAKLPIRQCQQMNQKENWFHSEVNLLCGHFRVWWQQLKMLLYFSFCRLFFSES